MHADTRTSRTRHHPRHRAADPRPGQAARRRIGPRQEHPRVPQGVIGPRGFREGRHVAPAARDARTRRPGAPAPAVAPQGAALPDAPAAPTSRSAGLRAPASRRPAPTRRAVPRPRWPTPTPCATQRGPASRRRPNPPRHRPRRRRDGSVMSLVDHLGELRTRLFRVILAVVAAAPIGFMLRHAGPELPAGPAAGRHRADPRTGRRLRDPAADLARSSGSSWRCR